MQQSFDNFDNCDYSTNAIIVFRLPSLSACADAAEQEEVMRKSYDFDSKLRGISWHIEVYLQKSESRLRGRRDDLSVCVDFSMASEAPAFKGAHC